MAKEIIINVEKTQTRTAIVEDGTLAELHVEQSKHERTVGDIFLGRIHRLVPSIRAAFVDIGQEQYAFLHFADLDENLKALLSYVAETTPNLQANPPDLVDSRPPAKSQSGKSQSGKSQFGKSQSGKSQSGKSQWPRRRKSGSPDLLKKGQRILVQVVKEPFSTKGTRVTTRISLAGRFIVLVPMAKMAAVSRKVESSKERRRLRNLIKSLRPEGFGIIVRTVAEGKDRAALATDLKLLLGRWRHMEGQMASAKKIPAKVHSDVNMVSSIIRDLFSNDYDRILVDQPRMYRNIQRYIQAVAPHLARAVKLHKDKRPIFEATALKSSVDEVFSRVVNLSSGGYLIFEETEAMHVIDVNSGSAVRTSSMKHEEYARKINLAAARKVARQIRLRDLGGIIVVDFIDMRKPESRKEVYDILEQGFATDRMPTRILPMTEIGLIQITRQRTRPGISPQEDKSSSMPVGGYASPRDLVATMELWLDAHCNGARQTFLLRVHPFTAAYLRRGGFNSLIRQWRRRHRAHIVLKEEFRRNVMSYKFEHLGAQHPAHRLAKMALPGLSRQNGIARQKQSAVPGSAAA